ncbi:MAG: site-2 protease family protein [Deltaproteobacteria bacterium]|nr:site-2 protease family protein [Deltaproteobacteria bacterium]
MPQIDIAGIIQDIIIIVPGFLLAITVHEFSHGYVAYRLGDPTAKLAGRLTFNPLSHLDFVGTLALVLMKIGWAKPVPVDPRNLRNPKTDMLWISLGGPAANLVAAAVLALIIHILVFTFQGRPLGEFGEFILRPMFRILLGGVQMNILLAVFNLIPVPPLDGFGILTGLLPSQQAYRLEQLQPYGFIILVLLLVSGAVGYIIVPPMRFIQNILLAGLG